MGIYKRGDVYYIDYYVDGRRIRKKVGKQKTLAQNALEARKADVIRNEYKIPGRKKRILFEAFTKIYLDYVKGYKKSWKSDEYYIKNLLKYFRGKSMDSIHSFLIEKYKLERKKIVKPATVNRELTCLKYMYNLAIKWGYVDKNPVKGVKFFKENNERLRFLGAEEEERLIQACKGHLKPIVITALNTGMRRGEILGLKWKNVDFRNWILTVTNTKNGKSRKIPMNGEMRELFTELRKKQNGIYVFSNSRGKRYYSLKRSFSSAVKRAELKDFHFHDLRHTFASNLVMAGVDLVTVKELLGHSSLQMTMRYSHLSERHKLEAVEKLEKTKKNRMVTIWSQAKNGRQKRQA